MNTDLNMTLASIPEQVPVVQAALNSRLEQLAARYATLKPLVDAATAELKEITDGIKAELAAAAPERLKVDLVTSALAAPLRLQAKTSWRLDTKKLKAENPQTYVQYAVKSTSWELRQVAP